MILEKINKALGYVAATLILAAALVMLYDVIMRYAFRSPSLYAPYIAAFLSLGSVFLGTPYALQAGGHVHVELIVDKLKPLPRKICYTIGYVLSMIFVFCMARACFHFAVKAVENNWNAQGNLPVPSVVLYGVMVLGSVLLFLALIQKIIQQWRGKPKDAPAAGEGDDVV